jgi:beta-lactamase superfamily II metal-dependent hydrolase
MYDLDVLQAGVRKDADAITARFTRPDTGTVAHVVIDAGWQEDGPRVVQTVRDRYGTNRVELAVLTHPDGDHIGGMGIVVRELDVEYLVLHRIDRRGGTGLPAADAVRDLVARAEENGTRVVEPYPGLQFLGGALTILGPDDDYYDGLVAQQQEEAGKAAAVTAALREAARIIADRFLEALPIEEVPFDDGPGPGPRNDSSVITFLQFDGNRALLTADAGVEAIHRALDYAGIAGFVATAPDLVQMPHHGSRRNASSELLNRLLGPIGGDSAGNAFVSVVSRTDPKHPAGRVVNAYGRRNYPTYWTAGQSLRWNSPDAPPRDDYGPAAPLPPMAEIDEDA